MRFTTPELRSLPGSSMSLLISAASLYNHWKEIGTFQEQFIWLISSDSSKDDCFGIQQVAGLKNLSVLWPQTPAQMWAYSPDASFCPIKSIHFKLLFQAGWHIQGWRNVSYLQGYTWLSKWNWIRFQLLMRPYAILVFQPFFIGIFKPVFHGKRNNANSERTQRPFENSWPGKEERQLFFMGLAGP